MTRWELPVPYYVVLPIFPGGYWNVSTQISSNQLQHAIRNAVQMMMAIDRQLDQAIAHLDEGAMHECEELLKALKTALPQGVESLSDNLEE